MSKETVQCTVRAPKAEKKVQTLSWGAAFLTYITDLVFALFVFSFIFHLPSLGLHRWANNVDTATSRVGLQSVGLLVIIFGILWCVAFALKSTADFVKFLLQSLD